MPLLSRADFRVHEPRELRGQNEGMLERIASVFSKVHADLSHGAASCGCLLKSMTREAVADQ